MKATAAEIDQKLREDFRRRLRDFGQEGSASDPVLAVMFRTFARQLEVLYADTDRIRFALLDELIDGLRLDKRLARPAQTVIGFGVENRTDSIPGGTELVGPADSGEKINFTTDADVLVSPARIALAATYQNGAVQLLGGMDWPDEILAAQPSLDPVAVNLGPGAAIYLAIEHLPTQHLSQHGIFFDVRMESERVRHALRTEPWCLVGAQGEFGASGILRPRIASGGVCALHWLLTGEGESGPPAPVDLPFLPEGYYAGRCFLFPVTPAERRYLCRFPRAMESALGRMFGAGSRVLDRPRAWLRISMPPGLAPLHHAISSVKLHAMTASNAECHNQTLYFDKHGYSVPVSREGGAERYLVTPLSVVGERGNAYLPDFEPSFDPGAGRYSFQNGRIVLKPGRAADDTLDAYVNLRMWTTAGAAGNTVQAGKVGSFTRAAVAGVRVMNLTGAAGGTAEQSFEEARAQFARALLSRERVVTRADLANAVRAFDRRIVDAAVSARLQRDVSGLQRIQRINLVLDKSAFIDPAEEGRVLRIELRDHLQQRFLHDLDLVVDLEWRS